MPRSGKGRSARRARSEPQPEARAARGVGEQTAASDAATDLRQVVLVPIPARSAVAALQGTGGNAAVARLLQARRERPPVLQAKLMVGAANDPLEREADRVADHVMRTWSSAPAPAAVNGNGDDDARLRRRAGPSPDPASAFEADASVATRLSARLGGGHALPAPVRHRMEAGFGADFGAVRIHRDAEAAELSTGLAAQAFTHGSNIYFGRGAYDPASRSGQHLLAHEFTHVVQQGPPGPASPGNPALARNLVSGRSATTAAVRRDQLTAQVANLGGSTPTTNWGRVAAKVTEYNNAEARGVSVLHRQDLLDELDRLLHSGKALDTGSRGLRHRGARRTKRNAAQDLLLEIADERRAIAATIDDLQVKFDGIQGEIWRQYIDLRRQHHGSEVFDAGLHGKPPEQGYLDSMAAAHSDLRGSLGTKMTVDAYAALQQQTIQHGGRQGWSDSFDQVSPDKGTAGPEFLRDVSDAFSAGRLEQIYKILQDKGVPMGDTISRIYYGKDSESIQFTFEYEGKGEKASRARLQVMFDEFYAEMRVTDEPLKAISRLHKQLEYLHPFNDANTRTNLALLNKLLVEYGFNPVILDDPNQSYTQSIDEWEQLLKKGMKRWRKVRRAQGLGQSVEGAMLAFDVSSGTPDRNKLQPRDAAAQDLATDFTT